MRLALTICLLTTTTTAFAQDRPLRTEPATTASASTFRFELGAGLMRDEPNYLTGDERDRWEAPEIRLTWSPSDNVELDIDWVGFVGAFDDPVYGDVSDYGDVSLSAKWRFAAEPAVGARFTVALPQTSYGNGLGSNVMRFAAELLFTQAWSGLTMHVNGGLFLHPEVERAHEQRDFLSYGLAFEIPLGRSLQLVAEAAGRAGDGVPGAEERGEARAGLRVRWGGARLDAAVRHGLQAADGTWGATAGITFTREGRP
jgi:hypothetical protein